MTVKFDSDGRYEVNLLWLENHEDLPDNRAVVEKS
jgi:hypothetical protein